MYRVTTHITVSRGDTVLAVMDRSVQVPTAEAVNDALPFGLTHFPEEMDKWFPVKRTTTAHVLAAGDVAAVLNASKPRRKTKKSRAHRNGWGGMSKKERKTEMARRRAVAQGEAPPKGEKSRKTA